MNIKDITVLFWDNPNNFALLDTQIQLGIIDGCSERYNKVERFYSLDEFNTKLSSLSESNLMLIVCHVDYKNDYTGYKKFETFLDNHSNLRDKVIYVSSNKDAHKDFIEKQTQKIVIYAYSELTEKLRAENIRPYKKCDITDSNIPFETEQDNLMSSPQKTHYDYAIITALYENEFEAVEALFDYQEEIPSETYPYKVLKLKKSDKKVIACFATKTGMVEASIIATEMINKFTPKYILMPGVCGGSEKTKFGSVIVAEKVFLFQKGKVSDVKEDTAEGEQLLKLRYKGEDFDKNEVTDSQGNKVELIVEKFDNEIENIDIDTNLVSKLKPKLKEIENEINRPYSENEKIKVQLEPMACSIMVINKEDYFSKNILTKDRDTKAVEMESYGVARAAKIANGGKTKWLIFKSVMDKTQLKNDDYKAKAAYTSAQFLKHLLEMDII